MLVNGVCFQVGWWAVVLLHTSWSLIAALVYLAVHFIWISKSRKSEAIYLLVASVIGAGLDVLWFYLGIMESGTALFFPVWLLVLWPVFLSTMHHSLSWLQGRLWLAAVIGAFFAPLSYWGGAILSPVYFPMPSIAMVLIATYWAIYLPLCVLAVPSTGVYKAAKM
jgi:hypothetical protein